MRTVAELLIDTLESAGIKRIYGLPGDSLNPLMDAIRKNEKVEFVQVRHEEGAALEAAFDSKYTGELSVCMGTSGPGSIHLLNGLYEAKMDHVPVLALTGQIETDLLGKEYFQEVDMMDLFRNVSVYSQRITNPDSAQYLIERAITSALNMRGVAHLDLPVDILRSTVNSVPSKEIIGRQSLTLRPDLSKCEELIGQSESPVIMYGSGCRGLSIELMDFAEKIGAPLIYALKGKGILSDNDPRVMGGLGLLGTKPSVEAMKRSDLIIFIGTDFPYTQFLDPSKNSIQVDSNPMSIGKRIKPTISVICDAAYFLKNINPEIKEKKFYHSLEKEKKNWIERMEEDEKGGKDELNPEAVVAAMASRIPPDSIIIGDTGNVTVWTARNMRFDSTREFFFSPWLGSMGTGIPGSIGLSFASGKPVYAIVGDGSAAMTMMELITAKKYERNIKVVVFNNAKLGMIKFEEEVMGYPEFGVDLLNPDFEMIGKAIGIGGFTIRSGNELEDVMDKFFNYQGPAILNAFVSPKEKPMPPKLSFEQAKGYVTSILREKIG
ncbi:thiamine pyrophosphate-dependent enzyme [Cuniculiplasma sp. SKW4]|uniref:thiamine pyrophosphate-dependent enzyme n=1 Tax=Cuniculiplasma sp. SKW4 TaxID=3400171 RepID=UPI003FD0861B